MNEPVHRPVLVREVLDLLIMNPDGVYVDGTVGAGGHSAAILEKLKPEGRLVGIDRDAEILEAARGRLEPDPRVVLHHGTFEDVDAFVEERADGILLDLGVSSLQLDRGERGFSFSKDAPLDMRMSGEGEEDAAELLARVSEKDLERILREYGEERFARRIAKEVIHVRRRQKIETTKELAELVSRAIPRGAWPRRIHPATRTFQALRIAVNDEMERLDRFLGSVPEVLKAGGRVAVISYHSLEDRKVKQAFVEGEKRGILKRVTKKPVIASEEEIRMNPRSRSAKLRVAEKTAEARP